MKENFIIMIYMDMVYIYGQMKGDMKDIGLGIKCMEKEKLPGLMVNLILEIMKKIRNMVKVCLNGLMVESILGLGKMGSNMEKEFIFKLIVKRELVSGLKVRE